MSLDTLFTLCCGWLPPAVAVAYLARNAIIVRMLRTWGSVRVDSSSERALLNGVQIGESAFDAKSASIRSE